MCSLALFQRDSYSSCGKSGKVGAIKLLLRLDSPIFIYHILYLIKIKSGRRERRASV